MRYLILVVFVIAALVLASCGGGGGGSNTNNPGGGGNQQQPAQLPDIAGRWVLTDTDGFTSDLDITYVAGAYVADFYWAPDVCTFSNEGLNFTIVSSIYVTDDHTGVTDLDSQTTFTGTFSADGKTITGGKMSSLNGRVMSYTGKKK